MAISSPDLGCNDGTGGRDDMYYLSKKEEKLIRRVPQD